MLTKTLATLALATAVITGHAVIVTAQTCTYVANADEGTVSVIDPAARAVTLTIRVGSEPHGVAVAHEGSRSLILVANRGDGAITVIDTSSQAVTRRIAVGGSPERIAVTPRGTAYVTDPDGGNVLVVDLQSATVSTTIDAQGTPRGISSAVDGHAVFVTDEAHAQLMVIDTASNAITSRFAVGSAPADVAITPDDRLAFVSSVPIAVLDSGTGAPDAVLGLAPMTKTYGIAVAPDDSYALLCVTDQSGGKVLSIGTDPATRKLPLPATTLGAAATPVDVAIAPDSASAYVTDGAGGRVAVVDPAGAAPVFIPVGANPAGIAIADAPNGCGPQPTPTVTPVPTRTSAPSACVGDCNGDGRTSVNELITGVNIILGTAALAACPEFDVNRDGTVTINEIVAAVNSTLLGCSS